LAPIAADVRRRLADEVDRDPSWVGPGVQLDLADVDGTDGWRRTFAIDGDAGFLRVEATPHPAGMLAAVTVWVRPERRRQGLAGAAVGELIGRADEFGFDAVEALVNPANIAALALFSSVGLAAVGHDDTSGLLVLRRSVRH
jgi:RimJ/RimL family protein N-acetyltransferase